MKEYDKNIHILERIIFYCVEIEKATERFGKTINAFCSDFHYRSTCAMFILQIGELASNLTEEFSAKYNKVPWRQIRAMRNIFAHDYENMNDEETWKTIEEDIPHLNAYCKEVLHLEGYEERGKK